MENKLIKVLNPDKAEKLKQLGFNYILDSINGQSIYAFCITEELLHHLQANFDANDFFLDNTLRF